MEEQMLHLNNLPVKTWNWLNMNESSIALPKSKVKSCKGVLKIPQDGIIYDNTKRIEELNISTGMGEEIDELKKYLNIKTDSFYIKSNKDIKEPLKIKYNYGDNGEYFSDIEIYAGENSKVTIIMDYESIKESQGTSIVQTKLYAEKNAEIRLIQVQLLSNKFNIFNDIGAICKDGATIKIEQLILGGYERYYGCKVGLEGIQSSMISEVNYLGRFKQKLDMNYLAEHKGEKSESSIKVNGSLRDEAFKLFRGTIDFQRGASAAVGKENEEVLLIGDKIKNKTIPLILCKEEDVEGSHGATIGKLDDEVIFYLGSIGISTKGAYDLIEQSRINNMCRKISNEEITKRVSEYIRRKKEDDDEDYEK